MSEPLLASLGTFKRVFSSMTQHPAARHFGQRQHSKSIVISSRGRSREYRIGIGTVLFAVSIFAMFSVGYIGSTAYLAFRDDLVASSVIRQARLKHEYEDRIAALRAKVDRITSRQMLDQQAVEARVAQLMEQQALLTGQSSSLKKLLDRANEIGIDEETITSSIPDPNKIPEKQSSLFPGQIDHAAGDAGLADIAAVLRGSASDTGPARPVALVTAEVDHVTPNAPFFETVHKQVNTIERNQRRVIERLHHAVTGKTAKLAELAKSLDLPIDTDLARHIGGPYIPDGAQSFEDLTENLADAFDSFETARKTVLALPIGNPVPGAPLSSSFGSRRDPFHGRSAFHSGLDFRASSGTPVRSTGSGVVVHAGRKGGYGLLVEVDHGSGITTRYAHLSRINVKSGQRVASGDVVGRVGSTGRSTGPHLHYEVRFDDRPSNPARYLKAGKRIKELL